MSEINSHCKIDKRLDLRIEDLGALEQLLAQQNSSNANKFCYTTSLGEELKFVWR